MRSVADACCVFCIDLYCISLAPARLAATLPVLVGWVQHTDAARCYEKTNELCLYWYKQQHDMRRLGEQCKYVF